MKLPIFVNSSDRLNYANTTSSNFTVNFPVPLTNIKSCKLLSVTVPSTIYSIRAGVNDLISWSRGANNFTALVVPGNWTLNSLIAEIGPLMSGTDSGASYTLNYLSVSEQLAFACTSSFTLNWGGGLPNYMNYVLGFPPINVSSVSNVIQSSNSFDLSFPHYCCLYLSNLPSVLTTSNNQKPVSFIVPLTQNGFSGLNFYGQDKDFEQELPLSQIITISSLQVQLYDEKGNSLSLNGNDFSFLLK